MAMQKRKIESIFKLEETLHIPVGAVCNNNCIFCMEDRNDRKIAVQSLTENKIISMLRDKKSLGKVIFTSGEPTLNQNLASYIKSAREIGFKNIGIVTNARALCYPDTAAHLLECGLTEVIVSIHSFDPKTHDRLTRTPGSFSQSLAGLKNLSELKSTNGFTLHLSHILCRSNLQGLKRDCEIAGRFNIDTIIFNALMPLGRANRKTMLARYGDIVHEVSEISLSWRAGISLNDVPHCVARPVLENLGRMEIYNLKNSKDRDYSHPVLENRVKRLECANCCFDSVCIGVWENYVRFFGWDEFEPAEDFAGDME